jgi:medium-chain acyl-[acyl-carrier-protein] hydrolase
MTKGKPETSSWFSFPRQNPQASLRLFCFPYAGGNSLMFRKWPDYLPPHVEVCAVQLPGRGVRLSEPAFTQLPALVRAAARALLPYTDKPFAFFGHSMGASIGFELARQLRADNSPQPRHLFLSARNAPQVVVSSPRTYDLPEPEFIAELHRLNGTPKEVLEHEELMSFVIPILRADFALCHTYHYQPGQPLDCPISVYGGLLDESVPRENLEGWREQTRAAFILRMFPGDHFFIHSDQLLLLRALSQELSQYERIFG